MVRPCIGSDCWLSLTLYRMLEVIGAAPGSHSDIDWHETWKGSDERVEVRRELEAMKTDLPQVTQVAGDPNDKAAFREFAAPFGFQLWEVQKRVFAQYWRTPSYIYSKLLLCTLSALFIGFSFYNEGTSQQSLQNQLFAIFSLFTIFGQLVQQILPHFVTQRALYEARERPSKTYSWKAFMISNLVVELPWNAFAGLIVFFCWYYPIGTLTSFRPPISVTTPHILTHHPQASTKTPSPPANSTNAAVSCSSSSRSSSSSPRPSPP